MNQRGSIFSVKSADESTGFLLWQVTNLWQREIRKALKPFGITHSQFVLLANLLWLEMQKQQVTQNILSDQTKIDPMTTSTVLRTLQGKRLVKRGQAGDDKRAVTVGLTGTGKDLVKKTVPVVERFDREFFSRLGNKVPGFNRSLLLLTNTEESKP